MLRLSVLGLAGSCRRISGQYCSGLVRSAVCQQQQQHQVVRGQQCRQKTSGANEPTGPGYHQPVSGYDLPRCGGIASMYRLPIRETTEGLDACFVGVPFDNATTNRNGTRFGPRHIRNESVLVRAANQDTGALPYESLHVADIGDVVFNMFNIQETCNNIRDSYSTLIKDGCRTLSMGGDHMITYPILQAYKERYGPVALVHVDAHTDTYSAYMGSDLTHGTTFRLAVEEGLINPNKTVQIGLRGSTYLVNDSEWGVKHGFRCIPAFECWHKSLTPLMAEVRELIGDSPVYISFDIDGIDPSYCPGTGTPEIGGLTIHQGLEIIRGCRGMNIVGADLVEVSPPYDPSGITCLTAANLLFEMMCVLPGVRYDKSPFVF